MGAPVLVVAALVGAGVGWAAAWYLGRARLARRMEEVSEINGVDRASLERDLQAAEKLAEALRDEVTRQSRTIHRLDAQIAQGMVKVVEVERLLAIRNADVSELRAAYENLSGELAQTRARLWERERDEGRNLARGTGDQGRHVPQEPKKIDTLPPASRREVIVPPRKKL